MIPLFDERERELETIWEKSICINDAMKRGALNTTNKERWSLFSKKRTKVVALFFFRVLYSPPSASRPHLAMNDFDDDDDDDDDFDDI